MKTLLKKSLSIVIVLMMMISAVPLSGAYASSVMSGTCGDSLTWTFDKETGIFEVNGTGAMVDYAKASDAPWYRVRSLFETAIIGEGVTSIGKYTFYDCAKLESVVIAESVKSIGARAFYFNLFLGPVYYRGTPEQWESVSVGMYNDGLICLVFECDSENPYYGGTCGDNLTWKLYVNSGEFEVNGTGAMYSYKNSAAPWIGKESLIKTISIKNGATSIGDFAFRGCSFLEKVMIPESVITIGEHALSRNFDLPTSFSTTYYYFGTLEQWADINLGANNGFWLHDVVYGCNSDEPYYGGVCGDNLTWKLYVNTKELEITGTGEMDIYTNSSAPWCYEDIKVNSVTIGDGVASIGDSAFENCYYIASACYLGSFEQWKNVVVGLNNSNLTDKLVFENSGSEDEKIKFEKPSTDTLKYGERIVIHLNVANLAEGYSVDWAISNGNVLRMSNASSICDAHADCVTCTVESVGKGHATITALIVDENGNYVIQNGEVLLIQYEMNSKAGFFDKIIAFFQRLFGLIKIYPQNIN